MTDFERALSFVLSWEGGRVNDPRDPGGRTNCGITQRTYNSWLQSQGRAACDVYGITRAEVAAIYQAHYWAPVTAGRSWPLSAVLFDTAVNCGPARALRFLEQAKEKVAISDPDRMTKLAWLVIDIRDSYYKDLARSGMAWALKGWLNRTGSLRRFVAREVSVM